MKATVKIGKWFARVDVGDCDIATRGRVIKHVEDCPVCQEMMRKKDEQRRAARA
jgi:hypothetical protein